MAKPPEHVGTHAVSGCRTGGSQLRAGSVQRARSGPSSQESRPTADGELPAGGRPEEFRMTEPCIAGRGSCKTPWSLARTPEAMSEQTALEEARELSPCC